MNFKAWKKEKSLNRLTHKLAEECGEVATIISDCHDPYSVTNPEDRLSFNQSEIDHLIEEAEHVIFIAQQIKRRASKLERIYK